MLAAIILVTVALVIGLFLGCSDPAIKGVMGLRSGQRNLSAALAVAAQHFDADAITYLIVVAIIGFVVLFPSVGELGKRSESDSVDVPA